jgi:hypothetical protein
VVLEITRHRAGEQSAEGQFVEFAGAPGAAATVRVRPWAIRYATPAQLDSYAAPAGFVLEQRWGDFAGAPFTADSARHVSVFRRA